MCDFAPRDGINMTDAIEDHHRAICAAFGIPAGRLAQHPLADAIRRYREFETDMARDFGLRLNLDACFTMVDR